MKLLRAFSMAFLPAAAGCLALLSLVYLVTGSLVLSLVAGAFTAAAVVIVRLICVEADEF